MSILFICSQIFLSITLITSFIFFFVQKILLKQYLRVLIFSLWTRQHLRFWCSQLQPQMCCDTHQGTRLWSLYDAQDDPIPLCCPSPFIQPLTFSMCLSLHNNKLAIHHLFLGFTFLLFAHYESNRKQIVPCSVLFFKDITLAYVTFNEPFSATDLVALGF